MKDKSDDFKINYLADRLNTAVTLLESWVHGQSTREIDDFIEKCRKDIRSLYAHEELTPADNAEY